MFFHFSNVFCKQLQLSPPAIRQQFEMRINLFQENKFHPFLHNHRLKGNWMGYWSINISGDWRCIYHYIDKNEIVLDRIGTHSQLY